MRQLSLVRLEQISGGGPAAGYGAVISVGALALANPVFTAAIFSVVA